MVGIALTAAVGIFVIGIVTGVVFLVSVGIRREERRFLEEHGIWGTPGAAGPYMTEQAQDGISSVGRSLNGLYVRHLVPGTRRDVSQDLRG